MKYSVTTGEYSWLVSDEAGNALLAGITTRRDEAWIVARALIRLLEEGKILLSEPKE